MDSDKTDTIKLNTREGLEIERASKVYEWCRLARDSRYNRCSEGWKGFGKSCLSYHGYFALFDALGIVSSPGLHERWYKDNLFNATLDRKGNERPSVLISGLATPVMAEIVLKGIEPGTTVDMVDVCETPLLVAKVGLPDLQRFHDLKTQKLDVLKDTAKLVAMARARDGFSGVVSDSFLTRFDDEEKEIVLSTFADILRDGENGSLITTWRIFQEGQGGRGYGNESARNNFVEIAVASAKSLDVPFTFDDVLAAYDYASTMTSHGGQSLDQIRTMVGKHFGRVSIETMWPPRSAFDVVSRDYARIYATDPIK